MLDYITTLPHYILPKKLLSFLAGGLADVERIWVKNLLIRQFARQYKVDLSEAEIESPEGFRSFNEFFIRKLKPGCRPVADSAVVSPVDGSISEIGPICKGKILQAKGRYYTVHDLLACDKKISDTFANGLFVTLYLSPKDYHRVHMPIDGELKEMIYKPGKLFSVQTKTTRVIPNLFAENERLVIFFETLFGPMAMIMVGATIVGSMATSWHGDLKRGKERLHFIYTGKHDINIFIKKGQEMGYFKLGSTVILLFTNSNALSFIQSIKAGDTIKYGEALATNKGE